jgi:type 1 glutamine amidotransferase
MLINNLSYSPPADLEQYDVIVSNYNTFTSRYQDPREDNWSDEFRQAYIDFVRNGKGHVVVHAGSSSFYDWTDYQGLVISSFKVGETDHGVQHTFPVRVDQADHPITRGLKEFQTFDELWDHAPVVSRGQVLASAFSSDDSKGSGEWEPVLMTREFGTGRSFTTLLGTRCEVHGEPGLPNDACSRNGMGRHRKRHR